MHFGAVNEKYDLFNQFTGFRLLYYREYEDNNDKNTEKVNKADDWSKRKPGLLIVRVI